MTLVKGNWGVNTNGLSVVFEFRDITLIIIKSYDCFISGVLSNATDQK